MQNCKLVLTICFTPALVHGRILTIQQHNAGQSEAEANLSRQTNIEAVVANEKAENAFVKEIIQMQSQIAQLSGEFVRNVPVGCLQIVLEFNFIPFSATVKGGGKPQ